MTEDRENNVPTGQIYYSKVRNEYEPHDSVQAQLSARVQEVVRDERFCEALDARLVAFFEDDVCINQLSFVAVLRFLADIPTCTGWKHLPLFEMAMA